MKIASAALGLLSLAGCIHSTEAMVREQAAATFSCADYALQVEEVGPDVYRASGCGQALIYACRTDPGTIPQTPPRVPQTPPVMACVRRP